MTHDHTPQIPEIFPQGELNVDEEPHRYETFEGSSGSILDKTDYTLDKAPIDSITKVTGIFGGNTVTFTQGTDYSLQDLVREKTYEFTFVGMSDFYELSNPPDAGSTTITDSSGDTFTENQDYEIVNPDGIDVDAIQWLESGSSPDESETFTIDYTVTFANSVIRWDENERTPDAGSLFYVSYRCESIISRYIDSADDELRTVEEELEAVIEGKLVDSATGQELDEIGKLFGTLGKRSGRDDTQYRIFLKSIVQSFVSRGTVNGIKLAISAATDVPIDDITIREDFEDNEYEVIVIPNNPVNGSLLEEVAQIADPSGINQSGTRFTLDPDEVAVNDGVSFTEGQQISEGMTVADSTASTRVDFFEDVDIEDAVLINPNTFGPFTDEMFSDDSVLIDPNQNTISDDMRAADEGVANRAEASDSLFSDDAFAIDPRTTTVSEILGVDDLVATTRGSADETIDATDILNTELSNKNTHRWEDDGTSDTTRWSFFEWTELIEFARAASDTAFSDDSVTIPPKDAVTSDTAFSADSVTVRFNVESISDTAFTDDAVTIPPKDAVTADTGGSDDAVTNVSETLVAWDTNNWDTLEWVQEHN